jgi:hypothetical protein
MRSTKSKNGETIQTCDIVILESEPTTIEFDVTEFSDIPLPGKTKLITDNS